MKSYNARCSIIPNTWHENGYSHWCNISTHLNLEKPFDRRKFLSTSAKTSALGLLTSGLPTGWLGAQSASDAPQPPKMLVLDKPFGMLDSLTKMELQEVLLDLWRRNRLTTLMVTHDVDEAIFLSDPRYQEVRNHLLEFLNERSHLRPSKMVNLEV